MASFILKGLVTIDGIDRLRNGNQRRLHYNEQGDSVLCFICMQQNAKSSLRAARSKEVCFISKGFSNGKKALARFKEHKVSECHKIAIDYETNLSRTCENVWQMSSNVAVT